jgi:class 3 adenylate cyclase
VLLADSVGLALQDVIDTLAPAERLAFVLHDLFDLPFEEIAGRCGILVNYAGGTIGAGFGSGSPASRAQQFLAQLEPVLPASTRWPAKLTHSYHLERRAEPRLS